MLRGRLANKEKKVQDFERLTVGVPNYGEFLIRYQSFDQNNFVVSREKLAYAGFYSTGHTDQVKCAFCNISLMLWNANDNPLLIHYEHSANCCYIGERIKTVLAKENEDDFKGECARLLKLKTLDAFDDLEDQVRKEHSSLTLGGHACNMCLTNDIDVLVLPCRHVYGCKLCYDKLGECCICQRPIESLMKIIIC